MERITTLRFVKTLLISTIKKDSIDDNEENEEKVAMLIDANTDVLLQTADCIIYNPEKQKNWLTKDVP